MLGRSPESLLLLGLGYEMNLEGVEKCLCFVMGGNVVWFDYLKIDMNNYVNLVKSWYQTGQEYISTYT